MVDLVVYVYVGGSINVTLHFSGTNKSPHLFRFQILILTYLLQRLSWCDRKERCVCCNSDEETHAHWERQTAFHFVGLMLPKASLNFVFCWHFVFASEQLHIYRKSESSCSGFCQQAPMTHSNTDVSFSISQMSFPIILKTNMSNCFEL